MTSAESTLQRGIQHPYDGRKPVDAAHMAALGVLADLLDRRGIRQELEQIDGDIRAEIVTELAAIIRVAGMPA